MLSPFSPPPLPYPVFCPSRGCLRGIRVQADPAKLWKDPHTDTRTVAVASPQSAALPQPTPGAPISCGLTVTSLRRLGSRWSRACALYGDSHDRAVFPPCWGLHPLLPDTLSPQAFPRWTRSIRVQGTSSCRVLGAGGVFRQRTGGSRPRTRSQSA